MGCHWDNNDFIPCEELANNFSIWLGNGIKGYLVKGNDGNSVLLRSCPFCDNSFSKPRRKHE